MHCRIARQLLAALLMLGVVAAPLAGAPIIGSDVTGSLRFGTDTKDAFDPANKQVPKIYLNNAGTTVTISATATEFGFKDSLNTYTADFTGTQLTISDAINGTSNKFTMTFTDSAFEGATLIELSDTFPIGGISASLTGSTITVTGPGSGGPKFLVTYKAVFDLVPGAAEAPAVAMPEPSSIVLFCVVGGAAGLAFRRARFANR